MKKKLLFIITAAILMLPVKGQKTPLPVTVVVFNEATAIPLTKLITIPFNPGIQVGTGFFLRQKQHSSLYQNFSIGYIFHRNLYHGFFINTELGYDYKFIFGLTIKTSLGIGYLHTFTTQKEYQFKNGAYQSGRDKGNSHAMLSLAAGLGYQLQRKKKYSPEIFMVYQGWAEYPYSPGFIPVLTHINLQLGTKFFINK